MKRTTPMLYRQGDVLIVPPGHPRYRKPKGKLTPKAAEQGQFIIAYGEVTGHTHAVPARTATLSLDEGGVTYLTVEELTEVRHQEHNPLVLEPNAAPYQVTIQREWSDALEPRQVAD